MAEARFDGMLEYLAALRTSTSRAPENLDALFQACMLDLERAPAISMATGSGMLNKLNSSDVPQEWKEAIQQLIQKKVLSGATLSSTGTGAGVGGEKPMQKCMFLQNYFLKTDWDALRDQQDIVRKSHVVAMRMVSIGLMNPTEHTLVSAVAIIYVASHKGPMDELQVNGSHALATLRGLKSMVKALKGQHSGITDYPELPSQLSEDLVRKAFGGEIPVSSPVDSDALHYLQNYLPARDTHASVRALLKPGLAVSRSAGSKQSAFQDFLVQTCMQNGGFQQMQQMLMNGMQDGGNVNLRLLPQKPLPLPAPAQASGEQLALPMQPCVAPAEVRRDPLEAEDAPGQVEVACKQPPSKNVEATASGCKGGQKSTKDVDGMAEAILGFLGEQKSKKANNNRKASPKKPAKNEQLKGQKPKSKASAKPKGTGQNAAPPPKKANAVLPFPGCSKHDPITFGNATVYVCPASSSYRVKLSGEKKDKAFSWKRESGEDAWSRVQKYVFEASA